jgi:predicted extracellular nuclease
MIDGAHCSIRSVVVRFTLEDLMVRRSRRGKALLAVVSLIAGLLTAIAVSPASAVSTELVFTQYVEGSSFNKAIEISNTTGSSVDLSTYTLELYSNGSPTVSQSVALSGTLATGDVFVVAHGSANPGILAVADLVSSSVANWNGDDAIVLRNGGTVVDAFGQVGFDPGSAWGSGSSSTINNTLCRNADIENGDTNPTDAFDPSVEWTGQGNDVTDGLGVLGCAAAPTGGVLFTQYVEGTSFNKAIEIANLSGSTVDLSTYALELYSNGNPGPATSTQALNGSLADGDVIVLANASANAAILAVADATSGTVNWNGDDAIVLRNNGTVVDAFGQVGFDPGSAWGSGSFSTVNNTLCRNDDVRFGDTEATDVFDPSVAWNGLGVDVIDGLGDIGCEPTQPPVAKAQIHEVQGSGSSVVITTPVEVTAIVTSLFTRDDGLDGFFIQEPDIDADADSTTSEGIFVFCRGNCPAVAVGDEVTVTGTPEEFFGMSQIGIGFGSGTAVVVSSGNPLPSSTPIDLPAAGSTLAETTFETTEGMIVSFPDTLVVSEYFELARYGQVVLTETERPYQFTDENAPSVAGYSAFLADLATRRIILDDDNNDQNDPISDGADEAYFYPNPGLSTSNRFRGGDTISNLTGVMHWSFAGQGGTDAWRVRPIAGVDYAFTPANPAPASPDDVGGSMTVASFNVLNYFTTLDVRGADSIAELDRQRAKIVAAIVEMDADVVGIIEVENDAGAATADLVAGLNAVAGAGTYDFVDTGVIGTDQIKVGFIYQPAAVSPLGDFAVLDSSIDPTFIDTKNRPTLIQTFVQNSTGERVTVAVNHLKSKGSSCSDVGDPEPNDGQASCAATRTAAAIALANYLGTDPTGSGDPDFLIIGDLNSYAMEDPIMALIAAGYTDLLNDFQGADAYSYLFDGQLGYLDYALANSALLAQVSGTTAWHINADEIPLFDYNDDIRDPGEASFERESGVLELFAPDALRSSDHDPVLVGLDLDSIPDNPTCNGLAATIIGTPGDDVIMGTNQSDVIVSFGGDDTIFGGNGEDVICSGFGDDVVDGGNGKDYVDAGEGDDVIEGANGKDVILGGFGNDALDGGEGVDDLDGGDGIDTCIRGENVVACELP